MTVKYVLDLRQIPELGDKLVHDFAAIVNDPEVDTVVEVLGGLHPSYEFVTAALRAGKNVVTANKYLVCHYFTELTGAGQGVRAWPCAARRRQAAASLGCITWSGPSGGYHHQRLRHHERDDQLYYGYHAAQPCLV